MRESEEVKIGQRPVARESSYNNASGFEYTHSHSPSIGVWMSSMANLLEGNVRVSAQALNEYIH